MKNLETLTYLNLDNMQDIKRLVTLMVQKDASDLYLTVDSPPSYRVNGTVHNEGNTILNQEQTELLAKSIMSERAWSDFESKNEANFALYFRDIGRFRVNVFIQRNCVGLVIRRIKTDIDTIDDLSLPEVIKKITMLKRGLVLVTGATGSGKSTSLAAMIDYRNSNEHGHIITVEDPIEFMHSHKKSIVTQREIGIDTHSYHHALKNTLRQAPDVILIGEIRDRETMEAAINFAETGHLCLATLHSSNANQTMDRIMGFFPEERHRQLFLELSLNLKAIISQRLVRKTEGGRVAAIEILLASPRIRELLATGKVNELKEAMEGGAAHGMQTFDDHLFELYKNNIISLDEALRNADSENNLRLKIKLHEEAGDFKAQQSFVNNNENLSKKSKLEIE